MRTPRSLTLGLVLVATTGGLAACGGGGGGGDEDAYTKTYQDACTKISDGTKAFTQFGQTLGSKAQSDPSSIVPAFKTEATKLFTTLGDQIDAISNADAPSKYEDFQKSIESGSGKIKDGIEKAKTAVAGVNNVQDLSSVGSQLQAIDFNVAESNPPEDLKKAAPACSNLGGGSAASGGN